MTADAMRAAEQAVFDAGVEPYALMERAGMAAAELIWRASCGRDMLVLCGPGNNGGDGYVVARLLAARGVQVRVAAMDESRTESSIRARSLWTGPVERLTDARPASVLVDALFGTGLTRGLDGDVAAALCRLAERATQVHAIDLPSGVATDSGAILSPVPDYDLCISLGAWKPAHWLHPAAARVRMAVLADIGVDCDGRVHVLPPPRLDGPAADAHKYRRGLVAVVGGAMAGAGRLASRAAAASGAGYVRRMAMTADHDGPDAIVVSEAATPDRLAKALNDRRIAALLVGPGLGRDDAARARLNVALAAGRPLVLDADALMLLDPDAVPAGSVLTPHDGEFATLFGDLPGGKIDRALAAARRCGSVVVAKGADSVIAAPDGRAAVARGASHWLSTAGTGDVLAGLVAGRLAVTADPFRAACEAVWLHGEAARLAGTAFIADDLIGRIAPAIELRIRI